MSRPVASDEKADAAPVRKPRPNSVGQNMRPRSVGQNMRPKPV